MTVVVRAQVGGINGIGITTRGIGIVSLEKYHGVQANQEVRVIQAKRSALAWVLLEGGLIDTALIHCEFSVRKVIPLVQHVQWPAAVPGSTEQRAMMGAQLIQNVKHAQIIHFNVLIIIIE